MPINVATGRAALHVSAVHSILFSDCLLKQHFLSVTVLCHVYITIDSYLSMRTHAAVVAQELLHAVAERMDVPQGELVLVAVTYPGGKYQTKINQLQFMSNTTTVIPAI